MPGSLGWVYRRSERESITVAKKATSTEKKTKAATKSAVNSAEKSSVKSAAKPAKSLFNEPGEEAKPSKPAAKKSASSGPSRAISVEEIGHVAGEVWGALSTSHGGSSVAVLKKSVAAPADLVMLALGWLAREDKIVIDNSGRTPTVSLR